MAGVGACLPIFRGLSPVIRTPRSTSQSQLLPKKKRSKKDPKTESSPTSPASQSTSGTQLNETTLEVSDQHLNLFPLFMETV
jgi:hypothetical protein